MARPRAQAQSRRDRRGGALPPIGAPIRLQGLDAELESGLFAWLAAGARRVVAEMCEADVAALCGERWRPSPDARVARAGWCYTDITLGGARVRMRRPRVRSFKGREIELPTFRFAAERDPLDRRTVEEVCIALSTGVAPETASRRDRVARRFAEALTRRLAASLERTRETGPGLLVGALAFRDHWVLAAIGIARSGARQLLGLRSGSPENRRAVSALLVDLVDRGVVRGGPLLFAVGEDPEVRAAIREHFGRSALLHRCPTAKSRRVLGWLPPGAQPAVRDALGRAYAQPDATRALQSLRRLARTLEGDHPEAARALRDGLEETLTLQRLGLGGRAPAPRSARTRSRGAPGPAPSV